VIKGVVGLTLSPSGGDAIIVLELDVNTLGQALEISALVRGDDDEWSAGTSTTMSWGRWAGLGGAWDGLCVVFAERLQPGSREAVIRAGDQRHVIPVRSDGVLFFAQWLFGQGWGSRSLGPRWLELDEVR